MELRPLLRKVLKNLLLPSKWLAIVFNLLAIITLLWFGIVMASIFFLCGIASAVFAAFVRHHTHPGQTKWSPVAIEFSISACELAFPWYMICSLAIFPFGACIHPMLASPVFLLLAAGTVTLNVFLIKKYPVEKKKRPDWTRFAIKAVRSVFLWFSAFLVLVAMIVFFSYCVIGDGSKCSTEFSFKVLTFGFFALAIANSVTLFMRWRDDNKRAQVGPSDTTRCWGCVPTFLSLFASGARWTAGMEASEAGSRRGRRGERRGGNRLAIGHFRWVESQFMVVLENPIKGCCTYKCVAAGCLSQ